MKKTFRFFALLGVCGALLLTACGKEDENNGSDNGGTGGGGTESAEWVDLGLPSGLLWAKCNLGATSPEEEGDFYAWGETTTKSAYEWSTYKYCTVDAEGGMAILTKYCNKSDFGYNGFTDELTTLEAMDDAAAQKLGGGARMPTKEEWEELITTTTSERAQVNGVNGRKFIGPNGQSLFLPAVSNRGPSDLYRVGEGGAYWSSSLDEFFPSNAWILGVYQNVYDGCGMGYYPRDYGFYIRAVRSQN